tara:strand:+ start:55 stop:1068 length:1014 start_codon:yes stop_codon:yes gene_type:complete
MQIPVYTPEYHYTDFNLFEQFNQYVHSTFEPSFRSKLILTFDTELFGQWNQKQELAYPYVLTSIAEILKNNNASASFCLLLTDGNNMKKTPSSGVEGVIKHLSNESIELHGYHHSIRSPNDYSYDWFRKGIQGIKDLTGRSPSYIAQPSWVWNDNNSIMASSFGNIKAVRGIQSGPNFYKRMDYWPEFNFRFPYRYFGKLHFPYQYIDWKYYDFFGNALKYNTVNWHTTAANITKNAGPCFMETIAHPFRLTCGNIDKNLIEFDRSIKNYISSGFDIISTSQAVSILEKNNKFMDIGDLLLMSQGQQLNLQNLKHSADLNRVEINTTEYVRSMELSK